MKILLAALNAKYIHTSLAVYSLQAYAKQQGFCVDIFEDTINRQSDLLLQELYKQKPDILGFSCYIWNKELLSQLLPTLKALLPNTLIFAGGPEVSAFPDEALASLECDLILTGEGEKSLCSLIREVMRAKNEGEPLNPAKISGAVYLKYDVCQKVPPPPPLGLDELPFPYENPASFENRILYYESSRGCPFSCQYCLSGEGMRTVRNRSLPLVYKDFERFLQANVRQVKLVDRTFNCDKSRSLAIWRFLSEHDNKITNFHFEIAAELLDEEQLAFLSTVRKGLFQFEIGVQSTNPPTLNAIERITLPKKLTPIIKALQKNKNIHLHLDLIAGLPFEDISAFSESFNYVYSLSPQQLQLGFLKLLKGSGLYESAESFGLVCNKKPPYEVLFTPALSYDDLLSLKMLEAVLDRYYNAGRFSKLLAYLASLFQTPFDCYFALGLFYEGKKLHLQAHSKLEDYEILFSFASSLQGCDSERAKWLCLYDCFQNEKMRTLPAFLDNSTFLSNRRRIADFFSSPQNRELFFPEYKEYDTAQLMRMLHIEFFPFNPETNEKSETALLFTYQSKAERAVRDITNAVAPL